MTFQKLLDKLQKNVLFQHFGSNIYADSNKLNFFIIS